MCPQNSHIAKLHQNLRSVRRAYLARAQPHKGLRADQNQQQPAVLSDRDREAVDRDAKEMMRELNWSIEALDGAERVRHEAEAKAIQKKHGSSLGALGSWAAGGAGALSGKTPAQAEAEERAGEVKAHRDGVLWYLRQRLQACGQTQKAMMEARLAREIELNRSLGSSQGLNMADFAEYKPAATSSKAGQSAAAAAAAAQESTATAGSGAGEDQGLSQEQLQMFEEGNQDMMKYFESMHESVQYVGPVLLLSLLVPCFLFALESWARLLTLPEPPRDPSPRLATCSRRSSATCRRRRSRLTCW